MTVVVAFLCTDGVVIAADSMLTSSRDGVDVAHHKGKKVYVLSDNQVFAFAGDQGLGARFRIKADGFRADTAKTERAIDYPLSLTESMISQFQTTGIGNAIGVETVLAFEHKGVPQCCIFENRIQPRLLDEKHFYVAFGSGIHSADPFLRFLVEVFCQKGPPSVQRGAFLATWVIDHVIRTSPGGVAEPIQIAKLKRTDGGAPVARELLDKEIRESWKTIRRAVTALRLWGRRIESGAAAKGAPPLDLPSGESAYFESGAAAKGAPPSPKPDEA